MITLEEILAPIPRISLQLSNLCNLASKHTLCPASKIESQQILPKSIVIDVLDCLECCWDSSRKRVLAWHVYNEPGIDPRLAWFIQEARRKLPHAEIMVWTNGWYLNEELAVELVEFGMSKLVITSYPEINKDDVFKKIDVALRARGCTCYLSWRRHDARTQWTGDFGGGVCFSPLTELPIRASGQIGICCYDCFEQLTFGDARGGFEKALLAAYPAMMALKLELEKGNRTTELCRRCQKGRLCIGY